MRIVIAPDKFKGSLSSSRFCDVVERALKSVMDDCEVVKLPLSDGGDGFAETISHYVGGKIQQAKVLDPLSREINASWMLGENGGTAFIEMAKASGLQLLKPSEYDCSITSSVGTGQLIRQAMNATVKEIIIGVGGSATNDAGMGMAAALGYRFLDDRENELLPVGKNLIRLARIDSSKFKSSDHVRYIVACDVDTFLCGGNGAAKMFARQKGASDQMISELEEGMLNYIEVVKKDLGINLSEIKGAGAGGGMGAGCVAFLKAEIISGAGLILQYSNAEKHIRECDMVITGEGKFDQQTLNGKLLARVFSLAKKYKKKAYVICGKSEIAKGDAASLGITNIFQLVDIAGNENESIHNANEVLYKTALVLSSSIKND